jgi:hypothetical protein
MTTAPTRPKIYHITNVANLASIAGSGLLSDAAMIARGGPAVAIGMSKLKTRRLTLPVTCHGGDFVGDFVPFYFCPRSVMLYLLHKGNHLDVSYQGGQDPIVHLEADMHDVIEWATKHGVRWAFTPRNAAAIYNVEFFASVGRLDEIDWTAVDATSWSGVMERKQAEFLVHGCVPWELFSAIGVHSQTILEQTNQAISSAAHKPPVTIRRHWYY